MTRINYSGRGMGEREINFYMTLHGSTFCCFRYMVYVYTLFFGQVYLVQSIKLYFNMYYWKTKYVAWYQIVNNLIC